LGRIELVEKFHVLEGRKALTTTPSGLESVRKKWREKRLRCLLLF
jgi:hypothetical protein